MDDEAAFLRVKLKEVTEELRVISEKHAATIASQATEIAALQQEVATLRPLALAARGRPLVLALKAARRAKPTR